LSPPSLGALAELGLLYSATPESAYEVEHILPYFCHTFLNPTSDRGKRERKAVGAIRGQQLATYLATGHP
jgi:hypothetical protein